MKKMIRHLLTFISYFCMQSIVASELPKSKKIWIKYVYNKEEGGSVEIVASHHGSYIGSVVYGANHEDGMIQRVFVDYPWRKKGLGSLLLKKGLKQLRQEIGLDKNITICADHRLGSLDKKLAELDNKPISYLNLSQLVAFYARHGAVVEWDESPERVHMKFPAQKTASDDE